MKPLFEFLELRRLLHAGHSDFHVNFQPASAPVPADYLVDAGQVYGLRTSGHTYGWSADNQSWARDRNSSKSPDQRYDTLNVFNALSWEIEIPNGTYNIHIVAGDAGYPVGNYKIDAEGVRVIDGAGTTASPWLEGSANVTVTDGKLTLSNAAGAGTNKICFIDIGAPLSTLPQVNVYATDANASESGGNPGLYTFTRGGDLSASMIVHYAMSGTASGGDYGALSGTITIPAGQSSATLTLSPIDDALAESTEYATLTLVADPAYQLSSWASATIAIADNDAAAPTSFSAKINFQPNGKPIPSGYLPDVGSIFGSRGNGMTYGWSADNTAWARDRDSSKSPDQRYDTLNVFNSLSWELAVPNGTYNVRIVAGDASYPVGNYKINVEGVLAIDGAGTTTGPFVDRTVSVNVTDGKLTVTNAPMAGTNKICFIEVMPPGYVPPPTPTPVSNMISWSTKAANPIIRAEALRATIDGKLYVFGGFSGDLGPVTRSDVYDPASNSWTQLPNLPKRITHAGVTVDGHDIYVAGGYVGIGASGYSQQFGTTEVWKYNIDTKVWTSIKAMPKAMAGGGAAVVGRTLYYISGNNSSRADDGSVFALNLDNIAAGWTTKASLTNARSHFGCVVLGGKIYVVGGQHGNDAGLTTQNALDVYDPQANTWKSLTPAPLAISHIASATVVLGNRIVMLGGETANGVPSKQVNAYDPATNSWTAMTSLPATRFSGVASVIDGAIYFTTGSSQTTTWKGVIV